MNTDSDCNFNNRPTSQELFRQNNTYVSHKMMSIPHYGNKLAEMHVQATSQRLFFNLHAVPVTLSLQLSLFEEASH